MVSTPPDGPFGPRGSNSPRSRSRDELLSEIRTRGDHIRRRRRATMGAILSVVAAILIVPIVAAPRDDGRQVTADGPVTTTVPVEVEVDEAPTTISPPTTAELQLPNGTDLPQRTTTTEAGGDDSTTTTSEPSDPEPNDEPAEPAGTPGAGRDLGATPTTNPNGPTTAAPTTSIDPRCHQSFDPACGPFFWSTPPGPDATPVMTLTTNPDPPRARQSVTFVFNVRDQDGPVADDCFEFETGDGTIYSITDGRQVPGPVPCPAPSCGAPSGAWSAPSRVPDTKSFTVVHTFATAGEYRLSVRARPAGCDNNPYADNFDISYRISVTN